MTIDHPGRQQLPALRSLWKQAFGDTDAFLDTFFAKAFAPERCFAVTREGQTVAALYWFDCSCRGQKVAYLYAVATGESFRGRGICRQLMEHTHRHLQSRDYAAAVLVPGSRELFRFYEKMDYRPFMKGKRERFACASVMEPVMGVDAKAYGILRRQLLPEGGVVQEGENLAFLASQMELFAGDHWLMAARKEGTTLVCAEYLGDPERIGGILNTLRCTRGMFPVSGGRAFRAMYLPLEAGVAAPTYFGLAFD